MPGVHDNSQTITIKRQITPTKGGSLMKAEAMAGRMLDASAFKSWPTTKPAQS